MDTVVIILIGAAITLVCGLAYLALTAPREEDYFQLEMTELLELTSGSGHHLLGGPESDGRVSQPLPPGAPVRSIDSSHRSVSGVSAAATGGRDSHSSQDGALAFSFIDDDGPAVPVTRDKPARYRVK